MRKRENPFEQSASPHRKTTDEIANEVKIEEIMMEAEENQFDINRDYSSVLEMPIKLDPARKNRSHKEEESSSQEYEELELSIGENEGYRLSNELQIKLYHENYSDDVKKKDIIQELLMPLEASNNNSSSEQHFSYQPLSSHHEGYDFEEILKRKNTVFSNQFDKIKGKISKLKRIQESHQIFQNNLEIVMSFHLLSKKASLKTYFLNIYNSLKLENRKLKENLEFFAKDMEFSIAKKLTDLKKQETIKEEEYNLNKELHGTMNSESKSILVEKALSQSRTRQKKKI